MYKNKKIKKNKSKRILAVLVLVAVALGVLGYFKFMKDDTTSISQEEQKSAEQADVDQAKQKAEEESQREPLKDNGGDDNTTPTTTPSSVSLGSPSFSQTDHMISSSVQVSGATSGSCKFTFVAADGKPVIKSASLSGGTCSVSISEAEFTFLGTWKLTVEFGSKSVSRDVNIS
jgi:hypothetical protein